MRNYEERAKDFVKMLFPLIDDCESVWEFRNAVQMFNRIYGRKVKCNNGIARVAFITSDYVVKMDYDKDEVESVGGGDNEIALYEIAEREGFAHLFAKVTLFEYEDRRFYIMPRIRGISDHNYNYAETYMTDEERQFCKKHHLSDLHCNNYGFRNGHVCLFDYACSLDYLSSSSSDYFSSPSTSPINSKDSGWS